MLENENMAAADNKSASDLSTDIKPISSSKGVVKATEKAQSNGAKKTSSSDKKTDKKAPAKKKTVQKPSDKKKKSKKKSGGFKYLTGLLFAKMMKGGAKELRAHADKVNKLNVFPVPDGDTGDNMSMTIESGVAALESLNSDSLANVMKAVSRGMLLGARGNSGVILSQFFAGIAKNLEETDEADPASLGRALQAGVDRAYASVMTPMEGTILTVARESVEYAISKITPESTIRTLFADLVKEMNDAVERTPETLAVLKEAGVVDSGGAGLFYIIDGLNRVLNGEELSVVQGTTQNAEGAPSVAQNPLNSSFCADSVMTYGYCTELLVQLMNYKGSPDDFDIEQLKNFLVSVGDSVVAFKTESIVKLHVHTKAPELVLEYMRKFGEFISVKIENMSLQHTELATQGAAESPQDSDAKSELSVKNDAKATITAERKKYAVVAVAAGPGIQSIFTELGVDAIVEGGQTNNPSTNDFIEAFGNISAEHIFVLPGNSNIIMAATQAAEIYADAEVHVINAKTIGQSYAALSSFNPDAASAEEILNEAESAIGSVISAYVSPSIRDADIDGVMIRTGDTIGVIDKEIVVSAKTRKTAALALINAMLFSGERYMLTVFYGADLTDAEKSETEEYVAAHFPEVECYFLEGGQEIYPYLLVAE